MSHTKLKNQMTKNQFLRYKTRKNFFKHDRVGRRKKKRHNSILWSKKNFLENITSKKSSNLLDKNNRK